MDITALFKAEGTHLFWARFDDKRVVGRPTGQAFEQDRSYVVVRLAEMYLGRSRTLWRKFSPLLHAFTSYDGDKQEEHAVVGPGQLQELGEANLDRVIVLNTRVAGPTPYRGGEVSVLVGLYSVPREDAAAALISTVGALAGVAGGAAATAGQLLQLVKSGVDSILGLGSTKLCLGVRDTFGVGNPLRTGFHVGIGAPESDVPTDRLWLRDGRLIAGPTPPAGSAYTGHDYFVLQLEAPDRRVDWPGLPGLSEFEGRFSEVLKDSNRDPAAKRVELGRLWPEFTEALRTSPHLTRYDAGQIANDVESDLKARLKAIDEGNPFETRAWGAEQAKPRPPEALDFAEIPQYGKGQPEVGERALAQAQF